MNVVEPSGHRYLVAKVGGTNTALLFLTVVMISVNK
jgi:hypothetical protein